MRDLVLWGWWLLACTHRIGLANAQSQPDAVRGVNLGGWLLIEQWITPSLFRRSSAADEWSLCAELGKNGCRSRLESHWSSFFTKDDFQTMRDVGLNSVRIPVGYWAVDVLDIEPYVSGQYPYLIQAVNWAQELGMSVLIDVHGAPGSQNGQDNSGLIGPVRFPDNTTNFDRSYAVLRNLSSEFAKPEYGGVVWGIQLLNEPRLSDTFPMTTLKDFYTNGSAAVRSSSQNQAVVMHDAFWGPRYWRDYDPANADASSSPSYITIDTHQYYAFAPLQNLPHDTIIESICNISQIVKAANQGLPSLIVGEWSLESGTAPDTSDGTQHRSDSQTKRTWLRMFFEAQLAAYSANASGQPIFGWYFWTWKTEYDIDTWSYRRGVEDGYIPPDVSNRSTWAFPILDNGCIDAGFNYTAPPDPDDGGDSGSPWYWSGGGRTSVDRFRWAIGLLAGGVFAVLYA